MALIQSIMCGRESNAYQMLKKIKERFVD